MSNVFFGKILFLIYFFAFLAQAGDDILSEPKQQEKLPIANTQRFLIDG